MDNNDITKAICEIALILRDAHSKEDIEAEQKDFEKMIARHEAERQQLEVDMKAELEALGRTHKRRADFASRISELEDLVEKLPISKVTAEILAKLDSLYDFEYNIQ